MMKEVIFDCEGDGLVPTKIHVFSYSKEGDIKSIDDYEEIASVLSNSDFYLIGHNIIRWDIPNLERLIGVKCKAVLIDTLALSWYLEPNRNRHGLEYWGEDLGIAKPVIEDWYNLSKEEYQYRCESDVKITIKLWNHLKKKLFELYEDSDKVYSLIKYLSFKMHCAMLAEKSGWKLDIEKTKSNLQELQKLKKEKEDLLKSVMPRVPILVKKTRPAKERKLDGTLTVTGERWYNECRSQGLDPKNTYEIQILKEYKEPNPNSHSQLKDWLFSLGWEPCTFKTNPKKEEVPQITNLDNPEIVPSIKKLLDIEPNLEALNGLFVLNHRISILEGFLESVDKDGYVQAEIAGLTNTLRFKHSAPLVNLPGINTPYGEYIRPCLIAEEGYELCGSDMAGLEDRTKQHYMFPYDPDYVNEMNTPDFDPHLDIALLGGMMTQDEVDIYKSDPEHPPKELKVKRHGAKTTNYSCTYGAFPPKIARSAGISIDEAKILWETYWKRNWAIKKIADACQTKELSDGSMWLYNPVSSLYYSLRFEKDRFSTLNQGTGSFCFDIWIGFVLSEREQLTAQFHDEGVWSVRKGHRKEMKDLLKRAIQKANNVLQLNRELDIGIQFGSDYGQIH